MAPRGRSATAGDDAHSDRSYDSSPDPLALSFDNTITSARKPRPRDSMAGSSPTKQNRRLEASEMMFSSPTKSMIMSTPRGGGASPWRIKVTVQAEPGSDDVNASPSVKRVTTRTKTTTVPLKDHDTSSPVKRPRGRPRKSDVGATPKPKRKGTPVKRRARSGSRELNMKGGESSAADVDTDVPPKKRRGRPRKVVAAAEDSGTREGSVQDTTPVLPSSSKSGVSKKSAHFADLPGPTTETMSDALMEAEELPNLSSPIQRSMRQDLRTRKGTPHANKVVLMESDEHEDEGSDVLTPTSGDDAEPIQPEDLDFSEDGHASLPTPSESSAHASDAEDDQAQAFESDDRDTADAAFDEGTMRMRDDTVGNESFTMISLDTLLSNGPRSTRKPADTQNTTAPAVRSSLRNEYSELNTATMHNAGPSTSGEPSPPSQTFTAPSGPTRPKLSRFVTPVIDADVPSAPPAIEPSPPKAQTPTLGRVVTAGVALQGLLDPTRLSSTPEPPQQALDKKRDELDDLFRGFSEGTRKELQAGLRLGEQLAGQPYEESAPAPSSPIKSNPTIAPKQGVFRTHRKRQSRLLTPEDQDHAVSPVEPTVAAEEVQYPVLDVEEESAPVSPARSEGQMSWRADTPPAKRTGLAQRDVEMEEPRQDHAAEQADKPAQWDDFADIWQEEASRSVVSVEEEEATIQKKAPVEEEKSLRDVFTEDIPTKSAARTWRRRKANDALYNKQVELQREPSPAKAEPAVTEQPEDDEDEDEEEQDEQDEDVVTPLEEDKPIQIDDESSPASEASDDTGMFFQSNMPNVFNQKRPSRFEQRRQRRQEREKISLSELLDQGESFVPESSPPPMATKKPSPITKTNPFIDTPPRFPALMSSPKKSSPLRRELQSADISTSSVQFEESTLPIAQSSPFHTIVDGDSKISAASDQRQFRVEMEGNTASTIVRVREEANEYLDAYEPQERTLNDLTEVTEEPSRIDRSRLPSSPPKMQQRFQQNLLSARKPSPLSQASHQPEENPASSPQQSPARYKGPQVVDESIESSVSEESQASPEASSQPATSPPQQPHLLDRVKSTLTRPPPPSPHPILSHLHPLPKIEPWTRTHYKALDKLYTTHLKHPALFCPSTIPPTRLSATNHTLLRQFLAQNGNLPYVGAIFHAWGYQMEMTEELVVMCSVFMQLLTLENEEEYFEVTQRRLQVGDCAPGRVGERITGQEVLRRCATVVMGESVRRDEREGRSIDRSLGLEVEWPVGRR
ncbi:uncharacterized protein J4E87_006493 [Alternaria ethzedia]|uniref:uncharacterized protein n=1 Tax=Alternaria ethzedia TaxID=181014 RepID=UPI0020C324C8|nr:uncharacterized protein J4E87_006493 [Alternaria ethzedia]KAI4622551.1 hypothetical protein J4E87_006493 [Alternaria ethzedia]